MEIKEYKLVDDLAQAYDILIKSKKNQIIGGCTFLRKTRLQIQTAIDLDNCGLDYIKEDDETVYIGAYTSFRTLEQSEIIQSNYGSAIKDVLCHLIGVQLRNHITVGAHVFSRYGFSDLIPVLMSLDAKVCFYKSGMISLEDYMMGPVIRDILYEIRIPKNGQQVKVEMMRNSYSDYSIFCLAMARNKNDKWRIAIGVRPGRAVMAQEVMEEINYNKIALEQVPYYAEKICNSVVFGTNFRASAEYRKELCRVFSKRAMEELLNASRNVCKP